MKGTMANYYTNFSIVLPLNQEQRDYAIQLVKEIMANRHENIPLPADFPPDLKDEVENWTFETQSDNEGIWLHSQYGGQESVCVFIQHLLQKFDFAASVSFEWSYDCTAPRTDAYGGGAAFITATEIETFSTSDWLQKMSG